MSENTNTATDQNATTAADASKTTATPATAAADAGGTPAATTATAGGDAGKAAEGQGTAPSADTADQPTGAPESYDFQVPEGLSVSDGVMQTISDFARAGNLTQEAAQGHVGKLLEAYQTQVAGEQQAMVADWTAQVKADAEIGGDKYDASLATANKAMAAFMTPEFKDLLAKTGLSNHPEMVRAFYKIGQAISEDTLLTGDGKTTEPTTTREQRMFPSMTK